MYSKAASVLYYLKLNLYSFCRIAKRSFDTSMENDFQRKISFKLRFIKYVVPISKNRCYMLLENTMAKHIDINDFFEV